MKHLIGIAAILTLAGCGQPERLRGDAGPVSRGVPMAFGPIARACMQSDRKARSPQLCGCIQAVANDTLSGSDQRRAAGFYSDPHEAQEVRQSDRSRDEAFWAAYRAYGERAEAVCRV